MRKKKQILIVDDENAIRMVLRMVLDKYYDIYEAANGVQALDVINKVGKNVRLVLLDYSMPGMNGLETLKKLKEYDNSIQICMISAEDDPHIINQVLEAGAFAFLPKPFDVNELMSVLNSRYGGTMAPIK